MNEMAWGQTWPSPAEFPQVATDRALVPVVRRLLAEELTAVGVYRHLAAGQDGTFLLESAEHGGAWGRWSFIGVRALAHCTGTIEHVRWQGQLPAGVPRQGPALPVLEQSLAALQSAPLPGLPPLAGALVGALGWDLVYAWEPTLRRQAPAELALPDVALLLAGDVVALDHAAGEMWLITLTDPTTHDAYQAAVDRLDQMQQALAAPAAPALAAQGQAEAGEVRHRTAAADFQAAVRAAQEAIVDGEVFQVVLSQRTDVDCAASPLAVYRALRTINPSPYMYLLNLQADGEPFSVVGSSPETLVRVQEGSVQTFPIAGSRPRAAAPQTDQARAAELLADPKELSEHTMLVDLARNDLTKVCRPESIAVNPLMEIKRFSHIMHISSTVRGQLRPGKTALDALVATFPAGTLSGAPKPRAVELIDTLEPVRRGLYGGVVGYFDFAGNADLAIAIRTAVLRRGVAHIQAGAGVVADSVPQLEHEETRHKAAAVVRAVQLAASLAPLAGEE